MKDVDSTQEGAHFHDEKGAILGSIGAINGWKFALSFAQALSTEGVVLHP
jgi:hypothetical protein